MAQRETNGTPAPEFAPRRPLILSVWIGLLIVVVLVVAVTTAIQLGWLLATARAQGLDSLSALSEAEMTGLLGIRGAFLSTLAQNLICMLVPIVHIRYLRRESLQSIGFSARNLAVCLAVGLGLGLVALITNAALGWLFSEGLGVQQDQAAQFGLLLNADDLFGQVLFAVLAIVVAPIGEETLFRGYLFNALRGNDSPARLMLAYGVSAALFSSIHLLNVSQGQLGLLVPIFVMGLILAAAMHLTRSLVTCIIVHMLNNSLGVAGLLFCINTSFPGCPV